MNDEAVETVERLQWLYGRALDEIYSHRLALAYEARVVEAHYEGYKTFPKSRRKIAEAQVERMRRAIAENVDVAYAEQSYLAREYERITGTRLLTRHQWEQERPR